MRTVRPFTLFMLLSLVLDIRLFMQRGQLFMVDALETAALQMRDWLDQLRPFLLLPAANVQAPAYWARRARHEAHLATVTPHKYGASWVN